MQNLKIAIIGAGNVGTHLAINLTKAGHTITTIFSRNIIHANALAKKVNSLASDSISELCNDADLVLICISDGAIAEVVQKINFEPKLIAHTAGSVSLNELSQFKNYGVFYPLQTFSKTSELNLKNVPFCIEANSQKNTKTLIELAQTLSDAVYEINTEQRLQCHLAAVFANNFSNHMFALAEALLNEKKIPFNLLKPLITETAQKVQKTTPAMAQTGPAARNDVNTIDRHLKLLPSAELEKLYSFVSQSIWAMKNKDLNKQQNKDE